MSNSNLEKEKFEAHPISFLRDLLSVNSKEKNQCSKEEESQNGSF